MGFQNVKTYDPLFPETAVKPTITCDCIICFEVVEHTTDPKATFDDLFSLLDERGIVLFSTFTQPGNMEALGANWCCIGPKNGHVSIYTRVSLKTVIRDAGFSFGSLNESWHLIFLNIPGFADHLLSDLFP
ncbi:MAG: class I SAM-dependent methyltransferase [Deltaproteobacteria bacterium]|nr:class I SAM-dependent methyltransferase [Deltaproteobacteria bacterium]